MTSQEGINTLYEYLKSAMHSNMALMDLPLYKQLRPLNSRATDVVINALMLNHGQVQNALFNVNVHIPNLRLAIGGAQDNTQPDTKRIGVLSAAMGYMLKEHSRAGWCFTLESESLIAEPQLFEYYINFRIRFYGIDL